MKITVITIFLLLGNLSLVAQQSNVPVRHRLADSLQGKLDHIRANGEKTHPDQTPTLMTEEEVNDYLASGRVKLPQGVKKVTLEGRSGMITGLATVDFDEIRAGQHSSNPLLSIFNGTHNVRAEADATGANGTAKVHVRSVSIDGIDVPPFALKYFIDKYITPKYPNIGIDSTFTLTDKIDIAIVGYHKLTVTQK
ncbi:MAG TPA: hypothetical protein VFQ43_03415 [Nitrososphaera sp.]|nr:hypothetical protein [Nitrososphaera sp.]